MNIAICDDDVQIHSQLDIFLCEIEAQRKEKFNIEVFTSGEELIDYLSTNKDFNIIFLDINMGQTSGIDVGKYIRDELHDEETRLIYISNTNEYAMDLFDIRVSDYIIKPLTLSKIEKVINKTLEIIERNNTIFRCKIGKDTYIIPTKDIVYFESVGNKVKVVLKSTQYEFYSSIRDIVKNDFPNFLHVHRSYYVNYSYISSYNNKLITLYQGKTIPIASDRKNDINKTLTEFTSNFIKGE